MAPDMWSRLGHSHALAEHPAFNPYNYQTGSVWPHDNALIALGFKRYGFGAEAARVARAISEAGSHFLFNQLPELYTSTRARGRHFPGAVPRRQRAAGLGRRLGFHLAEGDAGLPCRTPTAASSTSIPSCLPGCPT